MNLQDVTFILPIKIETEDRMRNLISVLGFLNHHFSTNVLIVENNSSSYHIISQFRNLNIQYTKIDQDIFHRTKFINIALDIINTPVTCVYDVDVFLHPNSYINSKDLIIKGHRDFVYPYGHGNYQVQISEKYNRVEFDRIFVPDVIPPYYTNIHSSFCGHCFFAKTSTYKSYGGENENFISYAPEDQERYHRFITLGLDVDRLPLDIVYHFEHARTSDSNETNPHYLDGVSIFNEIKQIKNKQDMVEYYSKLDYYQKYQTIGESFKNT